MPPTASSTSLNYKPVRTILDSMAHVISTGQKSGRLECRRQAFWLAVIHSLLGPHSWLSAHRFKNQSKHTLPISLGEDWPPTYISFSLVNGSISRHLWRTTQAENHSTFVLRAGYAHIYTNKATGFFTLCTFLHWDISFAVVSYCQLKHLFTL